MNRPTVTVPVFIVVLSVILIWWSGMHRPVAKASLIEGEMTHRDWRLVTATDALEFIRANGGGVDCQSGRCSGFVELHNTVLNTLRLAPKSGFVATISTAGGAVTDYSLRLYVWGKKPGSAMAYVHLSEVGVPDSPVHCSPAGQEPWVSLHLTPNSPALYQKLSLSLNLKCIGKLTGCKREETAPELWRYAKDANCAHAETAR